MIQLGSLVFVVSTVLGYKKKGRRVLEAPRFLQLQSAEMLNRLTDSPSAFRTVLDEFGNPSRQSGVGSLATGNVSAIVEFECE